MGQRSSVNLYAPIIRDLKLVNRNRGVGPSESISVRTCFLRGEEIACFSLRIHFSRGTSVARDAICQTISERKFPLAVTDISILASLDFDDTHARKLSLCLFATMEPE